jgi:4-carboxymuconolactone decarboxylase
VSASPDPRLPPLPPERWDDEDVVAALRAGFGGVPPGAMPNVLATMLHHPGLAGPFLAYNSVLLRTPTIEARLRELMILRVAWRTGSNYEWLQHVRLGRRYGVTADEVVAITAGASAGDWTALEADLLAATDQLLDSYRIDDATWGRLAQQLDERQLVEVVFVVGTYTCLAMAFRSFGLQLDADLDDVVAPAMPAPLDSP